MVAHACKPSTQVAEAGKLEFEANLYSDTLCPKQQQVLIQQELGQGRGI